MYILSLPENKDFILNNAKQHEETLNSKQN